MATTLRDRESIGERIRQLREQSDASVIELAKSVGIARGYWYEIERGEVNATIDVLAQIARALDVTLADLMNEAPRRSRSR